VREAFKGNAPNSDADMVLHTYQEMARLKKIGITFRADDFEPELVEALSLVGATYQQLEYDEHKKQQMKNKR